MQIVNSVLFPSGSLLEKSFWASSAFLGGLGANNSRVFIRMRAVARGTELVSISHMLANDKQAFLICVLPVKTDQITLFTCGDL